MTARGKKQTRKSTNARAAAKAAPRKAKAPAHPKKGRGARKPPPPPVKRRAAVIPAKDARKVAREIADGIAQEAQRAARNAAVVAAVEKPRPPRSIKVIESLPYTALTEQEKELLAEDTARMQREHREKREAATGVKSYMRGKGGGKGVEPAAGDAKRASAQSTPLYDLGYIAENELEELDSLCTTYRDVVDQIADLEETKNALFPAIDELARALKLESVHTDKWRLIRARGRSSTISREGLLEAGVSMEAINAATRTKTWEKYQIRAADDVWADEGQ